MTRWGAEVTPQNAWTEYPRPQMVRERWQNLNGLWDYAIVSRTAPAPKSFDGRILVPFAVESALSGVGRRVGTDERLWYRRTFEYPGDWRNERVLLHFGAVDWSATVWVNGGLVGSHEGGFDPFSFDITDFLKPGGPQEIVVSVWDPTSDGEQPRGKQIAKPRGIWYTPATGIWQTVWLEPAPSEASIGDVRITPDLEGRRFVVDVTGRRPELSDNYAVRVTLLDGSREVARSEHRLDRRHVLPAPNPRLWSPDDPFLYDVRVELYRLSKAPEGEAFNAVPMATPEEQAYFAVGSDSRLIDAVSAYTGMRRIETGEGPHGHPVLLLNGKPVFQYGPLDQGYWPDGLLTPPSDEAMRYDMEYLKQAGFNMLRKHIKVEPARYYYHADKLGLLIWQDMPSGMVQGDERVRGRSTAQHVGRRDTNELIRRPVATAQHELELRRMIDALYNHPSIITWVVHNEGWGQYDTGRLADAVKTYDPSRLVNAASGWADQNAGDFLDIHTYDPDLYAREQPFAFPDPKKKRPFVVGEFGGLGLAVPGHLWFEGDANWGYQSYKDAAELKDQYRRRLEQIREGIRERGVAAAVYTQTTDVEGEVNGLLTYDRKLPKLKPEDLRVLHQTLYEAMQP